jgi:hypothetical protein
MPVQVLPPTVCCTDVKLLCSAASVYTPELLVRPDTVRLVETPPGPVGSAGTDKSWRFVRLDTVRPDAPGTTSMGVPSKEPPVA